jgi:hypothetical protein
MAPRQLRRDLIEEPRDVIDEKRARGSRGRKILPLHLGNEARHDLLAAIREKPVKTGGKDGIPRILG